MPRIPRSHDRDWFRAIRSLVGPRLESSRIVARTKSDAKRRCPRMAPADALPEPKRTDTLRLQLIGITPPQELKVGIIEARAGIGSALAVMNRVSAKAQPEIRQYALPFRRVVGADEYVIDLQRHGALSIALSGSAGHEFLTAMCSALTGC